MKYMLLIYSDENGWTEDERQQCFAESIQLTHQLQARRQYIHASPLESINVATSVRVRGNKPLITDGPFAETREQLGGYFLVEANDLNDAIQIAAKIPAAKKGTVEIRPVLELSGLPERSGEPAESAK
ncbi:MAG: YciI family protein [Planctomycetota bacterium]|nr:YciI family protein [Planctomycetota bacterium]